MLAPAVLKVKMENKNYPPHPGKIRPQIIDFHKKMTIRTLPRTPREGGTRTNQKASLNTAGQPIQAQKPDLTGLLGLDPPRAAITHVVAVDTSQ